MWLDSALVERTPEPGFSEREFYLREFRGRTLAVGLPPGEDPTPLAEALDALTGGGTRVVLVAAEREPVEKLVEGRWLDAALSRYASGLPWTTRSRTGKSLRIAATSSGAGRASFG